MEQKPIAMLAIDMDGTLLTDDKRITAGNAEAVRKAMDAGIRVCISTGRAWPGAREFATTLGIDTPVITSNGSMIVNPTDEEILFDLRLSDEDAKEIYARGLAIPAVTQIVWSRNKCYASRMNEYAEDYGNRFGRMKPEQVPSIEALCERGVSKILWYFSDNGADAYAGEMRSRFGDRISIVTSTPFFLEFFHAGVSKAEAVVKVAGRYGIDMENVLAIGDAGNDIEMLRMAGIGVAMGNASEEAKAAADYVTGDNNRDGVAEAIYRFCDELKGL